MSQKMVSKQLPPSCSSPSQRVILSASICRKMALCMISGVLLLSGCSDLNKTTGVDEPLRTSTVTAPPDLPVESILEHLCGTITSRYTNGLSGSIVVDGRDHDSTGALTGSGIFGLSTCQTINLSGMAYLGGNGIAPVNKRSFPAVRTLVCAENQPDTSFPATPEAFLGLYPGALDAFKIPAAEFTSPFEGVVYITENLGPVDLGASRGILIVHNEESTSSLRLIGGDFKGLIICDMMDKLYGPVQISGAVAIIGSVPASITGIGNAHIIYSTQVLNELPAYCGGNNQY